MSTLNYNNYENHRPHSQIYQNKEIVPEPSPDRKTLVIIGTSGGQMDPDYYKGLVLIDSLDAISKKLLSKKTKEDEVVTPSKDNLLYEAAQIAFTAGGGQAFYVLDVQITEPTPVKEPTIVTVPETVENPGEDATEEEQEAYDNYLTALSAYENYLTAKAAYDSYVEAKQTYDGNVEYYWKKALKILSNSDRSMFITPLTYNVTLSNL